MMRETDYEAMVMEKGAYLLEGLQDLKRRHKIVGDVDGLGLALRMEICEPHDSFTPSKAIVDRMVDEAPEGRPGGRRPQYGLVLDIGGYYKNVVTLAPSLHITKHEMDLALKLLDRVMQRVSTSDVTLHAQAGLAAMRNPEPATRLSGSRSKGNLPRLQGLTERHLGS